MKKFPIELINRIRHFITQSINSYDGVGDFVFFFLASLFLEKTVFDLFAFCSSQRD